jgi:putative endonuclease
VTPPTGDGDHYVYVLECAGEGAKYTRGRTPVELRHVERFDSRGAAMSREYELKQLSRAAKERVVDAGGTDGTVGGSPDPGRDR